jgi:hypothetical protein
MMMRPSTPPLLAAIACGAIAWTPTPAMAQAPTLAVELEAGPVWQSYNDVEIPNDGTATRFSLEELAGNGPWTAARVYVTWNVAERHGLRLLLAPFSLTETGVPGEAIDFVGETYAAEELVEATYTFNSYRLTYRYRIHRSLGWDAWVGVTAKIRDATVALEQGATASEKNDLGFVPLLHLAADWYVSPTWVLGFDADALAGGPGRAIDAALKLGWDPGGSWSIHGGYRTLEGGADVEEVYTFAWLHYGVLSVAWRW